jgi:NAD(P)-dependent dehydrogenase (short-subunit alcohol dehydrogenase family)
MKLKGNTIFITGGGSGIGCGLAEALRAKANKVIISGRRRSVLEEATKTNRGMVFVELDIESPANIASVAEPLRKHYPELNVLINKAGIMKLDNEQDAVNDSPRVLNRDDEPARTHPNDFRTHRTFETTTCSLGDSRDLRTWVCPSGRRDRQRHQGGPQLVLAVATVPAQRHQRQGPGTGPAACSNRTEGCGTSSLPARHNAPGIGDRRARGSVRVAFLRNSAWPNDAEATKQVTDWFANGAH